MTAESSTIIVTGGAGYIGSHTCKALSKAGYTPVTYDSLCRGNAWAVKWGPLEVGDLVDGERLRDVFRKYRPGGGVIHLAALAYVGESTQEPLLYYRNNVGGTLSLLQAMAAEGVDRLVFSSTCATYGIPNSIPIDESMPQLPINPYGQSKLIVEQILKDLSDGGVLSAVALRYFNAAGADADGEIGENHDPETHLIPLMLDAARGSSRPLVVFGDDHPTPDGTCIRDYVHVTDLADAHVRSLHLTGSNSGFTALNLGTGSGISIKELIAISEEVIGRKVPHVYGTRREGDPAALVANSRLAQQTLGWSPRHSDLHNILRTAWSWKERRI